MKLEEGKFYRTRDGEKVGPLYKDNEIWAHDVLTYGSRGWYSDGSYLDDGEHPSDLIAEWKEAPANSGPVITETVTRKRIVPGVYGKVEVGTVGLEAGYVGIYVNSDFSRADLIAARDVFNQLIYALEE